MLISNNLCEIFTSCAKNKISTFLLFLAAIFDLRCSTSVFKTGSEEFETFAIKYIRNNKITAFHEQNIQTKLKHISNLINSFDSQNMINLK